MKAWRPRVPIPEKVPVALAKEIYRWNSCRENGFWEGGGGRRVDDNRSVKWRPASKRVSCGDDDGDFFG